VQSRGFMLPASRFKALTDRLSALLETPDAALRAGLANVQILGLAVAK
jgi:hypothetical protein